jgi:di/tricarboxylate transporter
LFLIAFILSVGLATVNPEMLNLLQHASIDGSKLDDDFTKYIHEVTAGIWSDHNNTEITSWKFQCIDSALTFAGRAIIMLMFGVFGISGTVLVYGTIKRYK